MMESFTPVLTRNRWVFSSTFLSTHPPGMIFESLIFWFNPNPKIPVPKHFSCQLLSILSTELCAQLGEHDCPIVSFFIGIMLIINISYNIHYRSGDVIKWIS
jgi:hypothetical protein